MGGGRGGIKNCKIAGTAFDFLRLNLDTKKRQIIYSNCPAAKHRQNDVMSVGHDDVKVGRHFDVICQ